MARGDLDLAVARIPFLKASERILLCRSLDRERDLSVLSISDLERLLQAPFRGAEWKPEQFLEAAARDRNAAELRGISFTAYGSEQYPPLLREIPDPPTVLFYRGTLPDPEKPLAAVVGTRKPSAEGNRAAYELGRDFGRCGVAVISGLALGIDSMAHRGNADSGAPTAAVLGSGLDGVYPASNRTLARRIVENGGVLLSEYPPGTPPLKWNFPARNRIIAGLCRSMVVVEAPERSGALISADFALDQGRDLWVASACLDSHAAAGCRALVSDGARVARSAFDVASDWGLSVSAAPAEAPRAPADNRPFGYRAAKLMELELQFGAESQKANPTPGGVR